VAEINLLGELDAKSGADRISASTYGKKSVDVAAIARNYTTAVRHGRSAYDAAGGSSNAAPLATGVAALV
jgi:subtilase family serine protease